MTDPAPRLALGVDGGNTKTIAIIATTGGEVLGAGRAGGSDMYNAASEQAALDAVNKAVRTALTEAGAAPADLAVGAFSMAGADWPEDVTLLREAFLAAALGRDVWVVNDAIGALRAGTPDGVGVGITLGTGIAIGARNSAGDIWYSGHWPVAYGGAELGRAALRAVYEAELGLGQPTELRDAALDCFGVTTVEEILYRCTARGGGWNICTEAKLAPLLLDVAAAGDAVALEIVQRAGTRDADFAVHAARQVRLDGAPFRLVLSGGVLRHPSRLLERAIRVRIETKALPAVTIVTNTPEPVVGALLLALDRLGCQSSRATLARLEATLPGPDLFKT
ncbi:MAG: BadF/BadG/BcrA/BcrD ATPase family protein [Thermomicrobiales bacterium]